MISTQSQADNDGSWGSKKGIQLFNTNLELNFKLLDSLKVILAGWLLPQTERSWSGSVGERMFEEKEIVMMWNKIIDLRSPGGSIW